MRSKPDAILNTDFTAWIDNLAFSPAAFPFNILDNNLLLVEATLEEHILSKLYGSYGEPRIRLAGKC